MDNSCKVPEVKPITIKRFGTAGLVPTIPTTSDCNLWQKTDLKDGEFALNTVDDKLYIRSGNEIIELTNQAGSSTSGTVTSVGLNMPVAFNVSSSPITTSGIINVSGAGLVSQYIRGDGTLANFPNSFGGGASVSYYLNGSVSQGTISGNPYYEISKTANIGGAANFTLTTGSPNLYFITDANDPGLLNIPGGTWDFRIYLSMSTAGGTPNITAEILKYDGSTFTSIASSSGVVTGGSSIDFYVLSVAVPSTSLAITDRIAIKFTASSLGGRTMTVYTQDTRIGQIVTSFSTGLSALNGLTSQVQYLATGTSGTNFNIVSSGDTHIFNIPTASAFNRGLLSNFDWVNFNSKLSAAVTSLNGLTGATQTFATGSTGSDFNIVSSGTTHTFNIPTASGSNRGLLSSTDWTTFNNKVSSGSVTTSGLTMTTARILGRSTAGTGAIEEITVGSGLTLSGGTLTATGGGLSGLTANRFVYATSSTAVTTSNNAFFDGTQIAFGTTSPIANTRTTILGSGTSTTTFGLQVHNSTGTNNAFVVRDDGFFGFNSLPYSATTRYRFNVGTDANFGMNLVSSGIIRISGLNDLGTTATQLNINGNTLLFELNATEHGRIDNSLIRFQNLPFNINQSIALNAATSLLNLNNTNNQVATSILNFTIAGGNLAQLRAEATAGDDNVQIRVTNSSGTLVEPIRFQGSGNVLIGTTTDVTQSILTIASTTKGILIPRMTTSQWDAISSRPQALQAFDTTQQKPVIICCPTSGINQWTNTTIFTQTATVTISNTTTETSVFTTGIGTRTLPANFMSIGKTIRMKIKGYMNETGTPTIRIRLKFGAVTIYDTTAVTINALGGSDKYFEAEYDITARTLGATGTVFEQGRWIYTANSGIISLINGASTSTATIDTTVSNTIDLTIEWGTASTSNNVNITNASIEILN